MSQATESETPAVTGTDRPGTSTPTAPAVLSIRGLSKSYRTPSGPRLVLDSIDLDVAPHEFVCIVGPSGAGKTTLLRCMSGLQEASDGVVLLDGVPVLEPPVTMAFVFQDYSRSLMPWMSVENNLLLPLRSKALSSADARERAATALQAVGLGHAAGQYPWQLSGGMQQRVAIARALAYQPEVLLMDEPFASVDAQTRADLEDLVRDLHSRFGVTIVLVTHDIDESVYLADRVIVLTGSPTRVREVIDIDLPAERDQLSTKQLPRYTELRTQVLQLIRTSAAILPNGQNT